MTSHCDSDPQQSEERPVRMVDGLPTDGGIFHEMSDNEDSVPKETLTAPQFERVNENEFSIHRRILTIHDEPPDIEVSRAHTSPDVEVSRAHELSFVGDPVSAQRDLDMIVAPSTAVPFPGDICAFPKTPDVSVSQDSESFVGTPVSVSSRSEYESNAKHCCTSFR